MRPPFFDKQRFLAGLVTGALLLMFALAATPGLRAQKTKDSLTSVQADQVRELGTNPVERIKLYLKFVSQRVDEIDRLTKSSHEDNRPEELRARFEEFTRLTDELSENIDTYHEDHADIRKALRQITSSSSHWPAVLGGPPSDPEYDFARKTSLEAASSLSDQVRQVLADEEAYFAQHKEQAGKNGKAPSPEE